MKKLVAFRISMYFCFAVSVASLIGCYSFTGASVPQHWTSIAIPLFDDESGYGYAALRESVTNMLIAKFQRDNTLRLRDKGAASVEMSGVITSIEADQPIAVSQGSQAARNQLVIRATVVLHDNVQKKQAWKKTFSASADYAPSGGTAARDAGLQQAIEKLTDDILLETISAW